VGRMPELGFHEKTTRIKGGKGEEKI
jgi:hypothetical protein